MNFILQETHFLAYQLIASTIKLYHLKKNDKPHICKMCRLSVESN